MIVDGLSFEVFGVAAVADLGESKTADVLGCQAIVDELFVGFAFRSMEVDDGLGVEEESDVRPHTHA